jgi:hypothetical protein
MVVRVCIYICGLTHYQLTLDLNQHQQLHGRYQLDIQSFNIRIEQSIEAWTTVLREPPE